MSFRFKTILGVALIEGSLLLFLIWSSMSYLTQSAEDEIVIRAQTIAESFANLTRDAVLSIDLARLDSVAGQAMASPDMVYVRFMDNEQVLAQAGDQIALARPFVQDGVLDDVVDGVFDFGVDITEGKDVYGRVEIGLSLSRVVDLILDARQHLVGIAAIEMLLVALFSFVLGAYLTRGLGSLTEAAHAISDGALGARVEIKGRDELAVAGKAFNTMSLRLAESQRAMQRSVADSGELARRLADKELRLSTILETAVDGFVTISDRGVIENINPAGAALFAYEPDELCGRNVSCLMPEPDRSQHDGYLENYLQTGAARIIGIGREVNGLRKDGTRFPLDLSVSEMVIDGRRMFVGLVRDITERKRIESEARNSEALMAAVVDANLDALVTIDSDDRIIEFSQVAEQMFGYRREEAIGQQMSELLIPPHMRAMHIKGMAHYAATGEGPVLGQRIEVDAMRKGGELFPVELTVQPIRIEGTTLFTAFLRDISERKAAEIQLQEAKQRAEAASEAKSRFLAHMSHEIRSPLNAVLGSVGLLLDDTLSKEQRLYAKTAQTSGRSLLSLINDILDFSKIEAGQLQLDSQPFALSDVLADSADMVAFRAAARQLQTAIAAEPGICNALVGDPARVRQILTNLMDNALKFTEQGAVVLMVSVVRDDTDSVTLRFTVQDTGIGIPAEAQARLFDEFQQVDSSDSTRYGGTGLGLSICKGLCQAMGGDIGLDSTAGRGSRFWADIPFAKDAAVTPKAGNAEQLQRQRRVLTPQVMIVGLHPLVRQAIQLHCRTAERCAVMMDSVADATANLTAEMDAILVDGTLPPDELAGLARQAGELGIGHRVLINPGASDLAAGWIRDGHYDDLLVMPLLVSRLVELLRTGPMGMVTTPEEALAPPPAAAAETLTRGRILLAEDSPANQMVARALLNRAGYRVDVVDNGRQALEGFVRGGYDLILMDLRMPEMNGLEATAAIRARETDGHIPIIAMTANALQEDVDRCLAAGMDDFVAKPVDKQKLLEALSRHMPAAGAGEGKGPARPSSPATEPPTEGDEPLIDERAIAALAEDVSAEAVPGMIGLFIDEIRSRAGRVEQGLQSLPLEALLDEAHTLKSCAGTFGAPRLQALARDMEAACREENRQAAENLGSRMPQVLQQTLQAYRDRFDFLA